MTGNVYSMAGFRAGYFPNKKPSGSGGLLVASYYLSGYALNLDSLVFPDSPLDHFLPGWFLAIHKDACPVNLTGEPGGKEEACDQRYH